MTDLSTKVIGVDNTTMAGDIFGPAEGESHHEPQVGIHGKEENMGFSIPVPGHAPIADEEKKEMLKLAKVLEVDEKSCLSKCELSIISEMESNVDDMDNLSSGEVGVDTTGLLDEWEDQQDYQEEIEEKDAPSGYQTELQAQGPWWDPCWGASC
jgi:hypothetical protein